MLGGSRWRRRRWLPLVVVLLLALVSVMLRVCGTAGPTTDSRAYPALTRTPKPEHTTAAKPYTAKAEPNDHSGATTTTSTAPRPSLEELRLRFPACFSPLAVTAAAEDDHRPEILPFLRSLKARYVPSTSDAPRYDHVSCFVMKARYNCAGPPPAESHNATTTTTNTMPASTPTTSHDVPLLVPESAVASDYKLVWQSASEHDRKDDNNHNNNNNNNNNTNGDDDDEWCDPAALVDAAGGPEGMLPGDPAVPMHVVLQGNSYLRQVWEALVCGFSDRLTGLTVVTRAPRMSLAYIESRRGKLITERELGSFLKATRFPHHNGSSVHHYYHHHQPPQPTNDTASADVVREGCHGVGRWRMEDLYRSGAIVPPNIGSCSDDMAVAEFGGLLRLHFVFHPSRFQEQALRSAYTKLGLPQQRPPPTASDHHDHPPESLPVFGADAIVWTGGEEDTRGLLSAPRTISLEGLLDWAVGVQKRSLGGKYFGADNPWIQDPPDNHPCMPGIPDDEANLLLYFLLRILRR